MPARSKPPGGARRPPRVRNIRLVPVSDPGYRTYLGRLKAENYTLREKRPPTPHQLVGDIAERAVRLWLERSAHLSPQRVLAYEIQEGDFGYRHMFRELDAVAVDPGTSAPTCVYEIKCSRRPSAAAGATRQLRYTLGLLRRVWADVLGCVLYVDLSRRDWGYEVGGEAPGEKVVVPPGRAGESFTWWRRREDPGEALPTEPPLPAGSPPPPGPVLPPGPAPAAGLLRRTGSSGVFYVAVDREWVRALALENGLLPDPELWTRAEEDPVPDEPDDEAAGETDEPWLYTSGEGEDPGESPLATALRKAGLGGGESPNQP